MRPVIARGVARARQASAKAPAGHDDLVVASWREKKRFGALNRLRNAAVQCKPICTVVSDILLF
jgi:hypothetical protein